MLKTVCAAAIAMASFSAPAFADAHEKASAVPPASGSVGAATAPVGALPASGAGGAAIVGGIAVVGVLGVVLIAATGGDNDSVVATTGTTGGGT